MGCGDQGPKTIYVPNAATDSGCVEDSPSDKLATFDGVFLELEALQAAASPIGGPVELLLITLEEAPRYEAADFPFEWDPFEAYVIDTLPEEIAKSAVSFLDR